ncbi:MAG: flavodoxin, partial [Pseudomonas sp.]
SLSGLRYAVLALGDRQYRQFCGFARRLRHWLEAQGASSLFTAVEVDDGDQQALGRWRQALAGLTGQALPLEEGGQPFSDWTLLGRECLNPGSQGEPTWLVRLAPPTGAEWQAGDILEVLADNAADQVARSYSVASIPADGVMELIVRRQRRADGSPGLVSGWLTGQAQRGQVLRARLRRNPGFHLTQAQRPLLLIGNGTGLAGLRALLKASMAAGQVPRWLLFGERNRAHDFYCRAELEAWLAAGQLQRLDLAFSRDQQERRYVQDVLREQADDVRRWVAGGAAIYVCGSLQGMAAGVDAALREILGEQQVEALLAAGLYRRDVY